MGMGGIPLPRFDVHYAQGERLCRYHVRIYGLPGSASSYHPVLCTPISIDPCISECIPVWGFVDKPSYM